jgi:hypothetical protein
MPQAPKGNRVLPTHPRRGDPVPGHAGMDEVFWFFFSKKNSTPFLKKGSQKLSSIPA